MKAKADDLATLRRKLLHKGAAAFREEIRTLRERGMMSWRDGEIFARLILQLSFESFPSIVPDPTKDAECARIFEEGSAKVLELRTSGIDGNGRTAARNKGGGP